MKYDVDTVETEFDTVVCDRKKFDFNLKYIQFRVTHNPRLSPKTVINLIETSGLCESDKSLLLTVSNLILYPPRRGRMSIVS